MSMPIDETLVEVLPKEIQTPTPEDELKKQEEALGGGEKPAEEVETEELDWDELSKKYPQIEKLGYKNVTDLIDRHFGGLPEFEKDHELVAELEKRGYNTPEKRTELFKQIDQGLHGTPKEIPPATKPEVTDFKTSRKTNLESYFKSRGKYNEMGELVALTPEEMKAQVESYEGLAEALVPSAEIEKIGRLSNALDGLEENFLWEMYKYSGAYDGSKRGIIQDSVRKEITDKLVKEFPATAMEIVQKARQAGRNWWSDLHNYYIATTQKEKINEAQTKREQEIKEQEAQKRLKAQTETPKKVTATTIKTKPIKGIDWEAREDELRQQEEKIT